MQTYPAVVSLEEFLFPLARHSLHYPTLLLFFFFFQRWSRERLAILRPGEIALQDGIFSAYFLPPFFSVSRRMLSFRITGNVSLLRTFRAKLRVFNVDLYKIKRVFEQPYPDVVEPLESVLLDVFRPATGRAQAHGSCLTSTRHPVVHFGTAFVHVAVISYEAR